mgnify:CR=1 FL=1
MAQGRNLQKTIKSLKEQLADLDDNNQADLSASKKLVQQKPQLLQWQAEYKSCLQKADELKQEKEQILALSPDTKQVLDLTPEQIKQLQADYLALPKQENRVEAAPNSNDKLWYVIGAVLAVLGLILLVMMGTVGVIALNYRPNLSLVQATLKAITPINKMPLFWKSKNWSHKSARDLGNNMA